VTGTRRRLAGVLGIPGGSGMTGGSGIPGVSGTADVMASVAVRRWALVAVVAALIVALPAVVAAWPATPVAVDPGTLRARVAASADRPWSGYAESTAGLGLPRIEQLSDVTSLLTGTTRLRAWYAGPDRARIDELSVSGERDRYVGPDGDAVWDYGATLLTLVDRDPDVRLPRPDDLLPPELARRLLAGTAPDDPVSPLPARRVAGVDAAGMRVTVRDPATTLESLDVWADPVTGVPVAVDLRARGLPAPVLSTAFRTFEPGPPDPALLVPRRGPGAGVTRSPTSDLFGVLGHGDPRAVPRAVLGRPRERPQRGFAAIGQYGRSASQLVVVPLPPDLASSLLENIGRAGSAGRTIPVDTGAADGGPAGSQPGGQADTQAGALQSALLSLAVVRAGDRAWGIGGLVPPAVLDRAVADVAAAAGSRR
jgi:hypothetical protein